MPRAAFKTVPTQTAANSTSGGGCDCCCHYRALKPSPPSPQQQQPRSLGPDVGRPAPAAVQTAEAAPPPASHQLKSALKTTAAAAAGSGKTTAAAVVANGRARPQAGHPAKPRPRSVALANPSGGEYQLKEVKLMALPSKQTPELVDVPSGGRAAARSLVKPFVSFKTVFDKPKSSSSSGANRSSGHRSSGRLAAADWKNVFAFQRFSHAEPRKPEAAVDAALLLLPDAQPLGSRPKPRSEINLSYAVQASR